MQPIRGTKDILPDEIALWQYIYRTVHEILTIAQYSEIRTPVLEMTQLFERSIGNGTDIVNKEMYSFVDQGQRNITLRPEGTASIARAIISNKLYTTNNINRLWYLGPMFRYERPQKGRQRQFHQLGIECIGISSSMADIEVIRLATQILQKLKYDKYTLAINCIGNLEERSIYQQQLTEYLNKYKNDLDIDSQKRLITNPLRILDSKSSKTQQILQDGPKLKSYLQTKSIQHFNTICEHLIHLKIPYTINDQLVRGLDYYNYTAFEIYDNNHFNAICGGGRYDTLIQQLGGPNIAAVGWAIGLERLISIIQQNIKIIQPKLDIYIAIPEHLNNPKIWNIVHILEEYKIHFEIDLTFNNIKTQLKRAKNLNAKECFIIGKNEIVNNYITVKILETAEQKKIDINILPAYLQNFKSVK
uniref:histidine--tRNA ligase n=1 Tax=Nitophyllum punctatum TaxID=158729 RepID=A0A4D6WY91_9FLOR|nr:Histidine-tRNA ligase [Nitophyllum punctatum]